MHRNFFWPGIQAQDSTNLLQNRITDSLSLQDTTRKDSAVTTNKYSASEILSILEEGERRTQMIDSIDSVKKSRPTIPVQPEEITKKVEYLNPDHIIFSFDSIGPWPDMYFQTHPSPMQGREEPGDTDFFIYESVPDSNEIQKPLTLRSNSTPDWFLIVFIAVFIQIARIRLFYGKFITPILSSLVNYQSAHTLFRNKNLLYQRASNGFSFVFFLTTALFFLQITQYYSFNPFNLPDYFNYVLLVGVLVFWYAIKFIVILFIGSVSGTRTIFMEYFHTLALSTRSIGLFLLPVTLLLAYAKFNLSVICIYLGLAIIVGVYFLRIFRLFRLFVTKSISLSYSILYLCGLEILPMLVLFRIMVPR